MLYTQGASTKTAGLHTVSTQKLVANKEYIFEYGSPAFAYSLLSPASVAKIIQGWLALTGELVDITGISIDSGTGHILIRAKIVPQDKDQLQAGVNPLVVFAIIAGLFAAIGIGISMLFVYELTSGGASGSWTQGAPVADPCLTPGVVNYVKCLSRKTGWVAFGVSLGVLLTLFFILLLVGREA